MYKGPVRHLVDGLLLIIGSYAVPNVYVHIPHIGDATILIGSDIVALATIFEWLFLIPGLLLFIWGGIQLYLSFFVNKTD